MNLMNKLKILLILTFFISGALCAEAASKYNVYTPTVYKQGNLVQAPLRVKGDVIELVVDYSGSMETWINLAKTMLVSILPKITEQTNVALRVFGQGNQNSLGLLNGCQATTLVSRAKPMNTDGIISGLNSTLIGGATPLTYALQQTVYKDFASLSYDVGKKIILVTDGGETCGGDPCAFIRNLMRYRKDIRIDVIMVNGSNKLRCLADESGGRYYNTLNSVDFNSALNKSFGAEPEQQVPYQYPNGEVHYQFIN